MLSVYVDVIYTTPYKDLFLLFYIITLLRHLLISG